MSAIPRPRPDRNAATPRPAARPAGPRPVAPRGPALPARASQRPRTATAPLIERRRHRRGRLSTWLRAPLPLAATERAIARMSKRAWPWLRAALALCGVAAIATGVWWWQQMHAPVLTPRHRAEALCFVLAEPPTFAPPMHVESGAAMVRGRFSADTPADLAIRAAMRVSDDMVVNQRQQHVGDYDVTVMWLRLPTEGDGHHWLVVGWMEDSDLAMCSFRFAGDPADLTADQLLWGHRLTDRILQPEYFQGGRIPDVRWRVAGRDPLPSFGPPAKD